MRNAKPSIGLKPALLSTFAIILCVTNSSAATEKQLYSFPSFRNDGHSPLAGVVIDTEGNLYGTTSVGGAFSAGTVFELSPPATGKSAWTEKILHSFHNNGTDGARPYAALVRDKTGHLYGATYSGGSRNVGTVFELSPKTSGGWAYKILHSFENGSIDGENPGSALILDSAGDLYGTTEGGGSSLDGTVFELSPPTGGSHVWTEILLHSFDPNADDGSAPLAGVVLDKNGNLYGTTSEGGVYSRGTVFELTSGDGTWTETVLHSFGNGDDGQSPEASLTLDASGDLYGTTLTGGKSFGTLFELMPPPAGQDVWTEKIIHDFGSSPEESYYPGGGLIFDSLGNLYGTTSTGGTHEGDLFEFSPTTDGHWTETILHKFLAGHHDGFEPTCNLIFDTAGNLYGTTQAGGGGGLGTVFEMVP